jgi:hypothetical protein
LCKFSIFPKFTLGEAAYEVVVPHALACFQKKFQYFVKNIERMDELFEAVEKLFVDYDDNMTINIFYRLLNLELEL